MYINENKLNNTSSSSLSSRASSMDIPDSLLPFVSIVHRFRKVSWSTSSVRSELLILQLFRVPEEDSTGEGRLWVRSYFFRSVPHVLSVLFRWF